MKERKLFSEKRLANGIRVFHHEADEDTGVIQVVLPLGHVHNTGNVRNGTAHFMEHVVCERSQRHQKLGQFFKMVGLRGGALLAYTNASTTDFSISSTKDFARELWLGLFSAVFEPRIIPDDIRRNMGIIRSERDSKYSMLGNDPIRQAMSNGWISLGTPSVRQIFGNDDDLSGMSVAELVSFAKNYHDPRLIVLVGGGIDPDIVVPELESLTTQRHSLEETPRVATWLTEEKFLSYQIQGLQRCEYVVSSIAPRPADLQKICALQFLGEYLTNGVHGPLFGWLRNEKGWAYDPSSSLRVLPEQVISSLSIPLPNEQAMEEMRSQLRGRIEKALRDKRRISLEVDRKIAVKKFEHSTTSAVLDGAQMDITEFGRIIPEQEELDMINRCRSPEILADTANEYLNPELVREFCAVPA